MLQRTPDSDIDLERRTRPAGYVIGIVGGLLAATIWGSWIVATRHAVTTELGPFSTGLLRFLVPAIVFMPFWLPHGLVPRGLRWWELALMVVGGGAVVHLLAASGLQFAPAAHFAALTPSSVPLFVALIAFAFGGERFTQGRLLGFVLIVIGVLGIGGVSVLTSSNGEWRGHIMFLGTGLTWALYTIVFNRSKLSPFAAAGLIGAWSTLVLSPFAIVYGIAEIGRAPLTDVVVQTLIQGFLSSVVAIVGYGLAVQALGAGRGAAFTCLVPAIATLLAIPVLGEWPGWTGLAAIALISIGVALASEVIGLPSGIRLLTSKFAQRFSG